MEFVIWESTVLSPPRVLRLPMTMPCERDDVVAWLLPAQPGWFCVPCEPWRWEAEILFWGLSPDEQGLFM